MFDTESVLGAVIINTNPAHLPGPEPLTGNHVRLERLTPDHFPDLYKNVGSHEEIWTWWPNGPFSTISEFSEDLGGLLEESDDLVIYTAFPLSGPNNNDNNKGTNAHGLVFAQSTDRSTNRVAELGLLFGPRLQRTRAGTEAVYLLSNLLFTLNHRRLQWKTNALNAPSRKAAQRYGFVYEGTFRQHQINKGRNRDSAWYSIIDAEWRVCRQAFELWLGEENFDGEQRQKRRIEEIRESLR